MPPRRNPRVPRTQTSGERQTHSSVQLHSSDIFGGDVDLVCPIPSKIQTFPTEILSSILVIAAHSYPESGVAEKQYGAIYRLPTLDAQPCTFTRVCKSWRRTALTTPSLWSHIAIELGYRRSPAIPPDSASEEKHAEPPGAYQIYQEQQSQHLRMVSTWLTLSRKAPLYLHFSIGDNLEQKDVLPADLLSSIPRWKDLHLSRVPFVHNDEYIFRKIISNILPDKATSLHHLYIDGSLDNPIGTLTLSKFPNLIDLDGPVELSVEKGKAHRLYSLRGYMTSCHCHYLIAHLPNLTHLNIEFDSQDEIMAYNTPREETIDTLGICMKRPVRTLELNGDIGPVINFLASGVSFPSLRYATFEILEPVGHSDYYASDDEIEDWQDRYHFTDFLEVNSSSLVTLEVTSDIIRDHDVTRGLQMATKLERLTLYVDTLTDNCLADLESRPTSDRCPSLTSLTIYTEEASSVSERFRESSWRSSATGHRDPPSFSVEQLVRTVRSRFGKNKKMEIDFELHCYTGDIEKLGNNVELQELQKCYNAFKLKIVDAGKNDCASDDISVGSNGDSDEDSDSDDYFGTRHVRCAFDPDSSDDDGW